VRAAVEILLRRFSLPLEPSPSKRFVVLRKPAPTNRPSLSCPKITYTPRALQRVAAIVFDTRSPLSTASPTSDGAIHLALRSVAPSTAVVHNRPVGPRFVNKSQSCPHRPQRLYQPPNDSPSALFHFHPQTDPPPRPVPDPARYRVPPRWGKIHAQNFISSSITAPFLCGSVLAGLGLPAA